VLLLAAANAVFHVEALAGGAPGGYGIRLGVGVIVMLISLIGGRVTPSFTRNWLARRGAARLPAPFGRLDAVALALGGAALLAWVIAPEFAPFRLLFLLAALGHAVRLARWRGHRTLAEPLVTILHVGYAFVPLGFLVLGAGGLLPGGPGPLHVPHAWTAGAVGVMTLAVMTRASLGHSGRALSATVPIIAIYAAAALAAGLRILAEFIPGESGLLHISAAAWIAGFAGFAIIFVPILATGRK
ncbi:MAG: NnrS family protein, partial [Paracoccaceae bacterium]